MNETSPESESRQPGVISHRVENGYYIVDIRWADTTDSQIHFPAAGFNVIDAESKKELPT